MFTSKRLNIQILIISLILKLIIQITLTLIRGIFFNGIISTLLISQLTAVAKKSISNYLLMKETEMLHQMLHHSKFASRCLERSSACLVRCLYTKLKRFSICYKKFISVLKVVTNNIYFRQFSPNVFLMRRIII